LFLNKLNKSERKNLIELAFYAANYNQDFAIEQQNIITNYKKELNLPYYKIKGLEFEEIIKNFDKRNRYLIFLEIFTLIIADEKYDADEREFINKLQAALDISEEKKEEIKNWVIDFIEIYEKGQKIISLS